MEVYLIPSAIIIGIINQIKSGFPQITGFAGFIMALLLGAIFGYLGWFGLVGVEAGFVAGLVSSGTYTVAKRIGGI